MSEDREYLYLTSEPADMGNEEFIKQFLDRLLDHYSFERLSELSKDQLRREISYAENDFYFLLKHFNKGRLVEGEIQKVMRGNDYRGLEDLTYEQRKEIELGRRQVERNIDRAIQKAEERRWERIGGVLSRLLELLDSVFNPLSASLEINWGK